MKQSRPTVEALYIPLARAVLTAIRLKERASSDEISNKRACASQMHSVGVKSFTFKYPDDGKTYSVKLARPVEKKMSVRKLYTLLGNGIISLDEFLECVDVNERFTKDFLEPDEVERLYEDVTKGLNLIIEPVS